MSKHQAVKTIKDELKRLNREIDIRIIKGLSYKDQSRRHKFLTLQLKNLTQSHHSWFSRSFGLISSFTF